MLPDDLAPLRRLWWLPFCVLLFLEFAWTPIWFFIARVHPLPLSAYGWSRTALLLGVEIAWLAVAWPRLKTGGAYQMLLGIQAALPLFWMTAGFFGLNRWMMSGSVIHVGAYMAWYLIAPLAQLAFLAGAFALRAQDPEEAQDAVQASAGLVVMGGGWLGVGLGSLLTWIWNDPLPSDLCGERPEAGRRASIIGLAFLVGGPILAVLSICSGVSGSHGTARAVEILPGLFVGSLAWNGMATRMGARGWGILTWLLIGFGLLLTLAILLILAMLFQHVPGG